MIFIPEFTLFVFSLASISSSSQVEYSLDGYIYVLEYQLTEITASKFSVERCGIYVIVIIIIDAAAIIITLLLLVSGRSNTSEIR